MEVGIHFTKHGRSLRFIQKYFCPCSTSYLKWDPIKSVPAGNYGLWTGKNVPFSRSPVIYFFFVGTNPTDRLFPSLNVYRPSIDMNLLQNVDCELIFCSSFVSPLNLVCSPHIWLYLLCFGPLLHHQHDIYR